jgi:hypothetical protein
MSPLRELPAVIVLALLIWGEARSEPIEGQVGVACVARNRVLREGHDWIAVCLAPKQFSCFNVDDVNYPKILRAADVLMTGELTPELKQALWIAEGVIAGHVIDNTGNAKNYLTTALLQSRPPSWAVGRPILARLGAHSFLTA